MIKEFFDLQKRHTTHTFSPYKNFFLNQIVNIFTFTSSIISVITITLVIYLFCKHKHIRTIVGSLILHKAKEVEAKLTNLQKRHTTHTFSPYKNFFLNQIVNIFTFTSSIISVITITLVIYLFCKHKHIRTIVGSLILYKAKEVEAKLTTETNNPEWGTLGYTGMTLTIFSMAVVIFSTL